MTNAVITWIEDKFGILKTEVVEYAPNALAFFKNLITGLTPVIEDAATKGVLAAVTAPGDGAAKALYAFGVASADLTEKGVPIIENDLKAYIQAAYKNLPQPVQDNAAAQAVEAKVDGEIDRAAAKVEASVPAAQ